MVLNTQYLSVEGAVTAIIDAFQNRTFVFEDDETGMETGRQAGVKKTGGASQSATR